ncbi:MAG: hypothetical protein ACC652_15595 [Acidimicrobiales bacterium]
MRDRGMGLGENVALRAFAAQHYGVFRACDLYSIGLSKQQVYVLCRGGVLTHDSR